MVDGSRYTVINLMPKLSLLERVFGEDFWIPKNNYEVVVFPNEYLKNYQILYPPCVDETSGSIPTLRVVQSQSPRPPLKPDQVDLRVTTHVVFSYANKTETLSIFRTHDGNEAIDFCRRCEECRVLFKMLGRQLK